jgi:glycosyltransferase involved in cell wall biosynthesis
MPKVSVVMPVYQDEQYLQQAIDSILGQTFRDFELLIISEADSSDNTISIINSYSDSRIRHFHNRSRLGLVRSLNVGIQKARGEYVARMDSDDVCRPQRLSKQVRFLDEHGEVGVLGASAVIINQQGKPYARFSAPTMPELIDWFLLFGEALAHPTVMIRKSTCQELSGYAYEYPYAEDYDLWLRARRVTRIANLPDALLQLRKHTANISRANTKVGIESQIRLLTREASSILRNEVEREVLRTLIGHQLADSGDAVEAAKFVRSICVGFIRQKNVSRLAERAIRADAARRMSVMARLSIKSNPLSALRIVMMAISASPTDWTPCMNDFFRLSRV